MNQCAVDPSAARPVAAVRNPAGCGRTVRAVATLAAVLLLGACASPPAGDRYLSSEVNDPFEPVNRGIFFLNDGVDTMVVRPAAEYYRGLVPQPVRNSVRSGLNNLKTPVILANDLLQGEFDRAGTTISRFAINSTVGVLGLFDVAADMGMPRHSEDFGQTMAVWGVPDGPYLVLPLLGPSNPRDAVGRAVDTVFDPIDWYGRTDAAGANFETFSFTRTVVGAVDTREEFINRLDELRRQSVDFYAAVRSSYRQLRAREIANGRNGGGESGPTSFVPEGADFDLP